MDWGSVLGGATAGPLGAITGLIGVGITKYADYKQARLDAEERGKDREHELNVMSKEGELAKQQAEIKLEEVVTTAEIKLQEDSYKHDKATYSNKLMEFMKDGKAKNFIIFCLAMVDVARGLIRPIITTYYQLLLTAYGAWAGWYLNKLVKSGVMSIDMAEVTTKAVNDTLATVIYLAVTTGVWWFGVRVQQPRNQSNG